MMTEFINGVEMLSESAGTTIRDDGRYGNMSQFLAIRGKPANELYPIKLMTKLIEMFGEPNLIKLKDSMDALGKFDFQKYIDSISKRAHITTFEIIRTTINPNPKKELNRRPCINPLNEMIDHFMGARHAVKTQMYINNLSK